MIRTNVPIWVTDVNFHPVFLNRQMQKDFGVQTGDKLLRCDRAEAVLKDLDPTSPEIRAVSCPMQYADGTTHITISYFRALLFNGRHYGYIGTSLRQGWRSQTPQPLRAIISPETPRISTVLGGVVIDFVSAYQRSLGPLLTVSAHDDCLDLDAFRQELAVLSMLDNLALNAFLPRADFINGLPGYGDVNLQLIEEMHCTGKLWSMFMSRPWKFKSGAAFNPPYLDLLLWCRGAGISCSTVDITRVSVNEKIAAHRIDVHADDDPEDWALALFHGTPCFLFDRPWNRSIRTPFRVRSVEQVLTQCGVEPVQTYSDYDPLLMAKAV